MYEIFAKLCEERNITPYKVSKDTKVSRTTLSDWKNGKSEPKIDKIRIIADYFGVSVDYLKYGKESNEEDRFSINNRELSSLLRHDKALSNALMRYSEMPEEKKEFVVKFIELLSQ